MIELLRRQIWTATLGGAMALLATGCHGPDAPVEGESLEQLVAEKVQSNEELVHILKSIEDEESIKQAWPELLRHHKKEEALSKRFKKLSRPPEDVLASMKPYVERMAQARDNHKAEMERIRDRVPGGPAFIEQLQNLTASELLLPLREDERP